jgi:hypothetical protein
MANTELKFTIVGDSVWVSLEDFWKMLRRWKVEGAKIYPEHTIPKPEKKKKR